jgi:hypothetical protein
VNFLNSKFRAALSLSALGILFLPAFVQAQAPKYVPPPPPTKHVVLELRARYLLPPDIEFSNFGTIPFRDSYESNNNLFTGEERLIAYDDGELRQDYITTSLVEGGATGTDVVPSPNTDATSAFIYEDPAQVDPDDPTMLLFHRYASATPSDFVLEGSASGSIGWELNYTKYINPRRNLGIQVGFSFTGFDSRFNDTIDADLYVQEFKHSMANGDLVPDLPDPIENEDGSITQDPYVGDQVRDELDSGNLLDWLAVEETEELIPAGATVDSRADLRSSVYNFRAGPTYSLGLGQRFSVNLGAGVSALYFSGRFSAYEILMIDPDGINPSRGLSTTDEAEWQVGGYVDANAYYHFTERINLFSGFQVQSGSSYTQMNEEREATVDFSSQVYVHAGVGIRF